VIGAAGTLTVYPPWKLAVVGSMKLAGGELEPDTVRVCGGGNKSKYDYHGKNKIN
jgi:hypothetical protein